jgi:hypothetical protein
VDVPLPWERLLWSCRSLTLPRSRIVLTDFRLVRLDRDRFAEIAIQDVAEVRRSESRLDKLLGTSSLVVAHRDRRRAALILPHVRRGVQLAALLDLLADDPSASIDPDAVNAALLWEPRTGRHPVRRAVLGLAAVTVILFAVGIGLHGSSTAITYPPETRSIRTAGSRTPLSSRASWKQRSCPGRDKRWGQSSAALNA